jgi:putative ABC transport system permease protein
MLHNYLITALRNFTRHKLYSFINIAGLTVGLTCAIFIILFVRDELSYDKWIPGSANLYRAELTWHVPGRAPWRLATAPFPLLRAMQEQIPGVNATTHMMPETMTVATDERQFLERIMTVDPNFFRVIKLPLVEGNAASVLAQPESIVLSQSLARKYFGSSDPVGKTVTVKAPNWSDNPGVTTVHSLTVTGVFRDLPHNTQLAADLVMPNTSQADEMSQSDKEQSWTSTDGGYDYVSLSPGTDPRTVLTKLGPILDRDITPKMLSGEASRGSDFETFDLIPFWNVHLTSDQYGGMRPPGSWMTVYGFAAIGVLIVLIACFNFTNLATARAMVRAREISLRKVMGARRAQVMVQFLGESILTALMSLILALALVEMLLPLYDRMLGKPIQLHYLADWPLLLTLLGMAVLAGLLAGFYPALVLSGFRPASTLRINTAGQTGSGILRTSLVISQFAVSIGLGIAAMVVFRQIDFARNIDLGFNRDGMVIIRGANYMTPDALKSFAQTLDANPEIAGVALSNAVPFDLFNVSNGPIQIQGQRESFSAHIANISPEFPKLYDIRLLAGRLLSTDYGEDVTSISTPNKTMNVLINAETARRFGYMPKDAIGRTVGFFGRNARIVGVVADAKIDGMKDPVLPTMYLDDPTRNTLISIRIRARGIPDTLSFIDRTWRKFAPGSAMQRHFLSDTFNNLFEADEVQGRMFGIFVGIAIFIACLGLFGLASFTSERRTKEIGLRKTFGARTRDIILMLLWQFSIPVLIANVIAWPIAYYYLHGWLEGYAYRISLSPLYFVGAGVAALVIAWATVFVHASRVAKANPIHALRYE